jgi:hypothetical protein
MSYGTCLRFFKYLLVSVLFTSGTWSCASSTTFTVPEKGESQKSMVGSLSLHVRNQAWIPVKNVVWQDSLVTVTTKHGMKKIFHQREVVLLRNKSVLRATGRGFIGIVLGSFAGVGVGATIGFVIDAGAGSQFIPASLVLGLLGGVVGAPTGLAAGASIGYKSDYFFNRADCKTCKSNGAFARPVKPEHYGRFTEKKAGSASITYDSAATALIASRDSLSKVFATQDSLASLPVVKLLFRYHDKIAVFERVSDNTQPGTFELPFIPTLGNRSPEEAAQRLLAESFGLENIPLQPLEQVTLRSKEKSVGRYQPFIIKAASDLKTPAGYAAIRWIDRTAAKTGTWSPEDEKILRLIFR